MQIILKFPLSPKFVDCVTDLIIFKMLCYLHRFVQVEAGKRKNHQMDFRSCPKEKDFPREQSQIVGSIKMNKHISRKTD